MNPWLYVALAVASIALVMVKPVRRRFKRRAYRSYQSDTSRTAELPAVETMADMVWGKRS